MPRRTVRRPHRGNALDSRRVDGRCTYRAYGVFRCRAARPGYLAWLDGLWRCDAHAIRAGRG
jgi:hypothetical protein